MTTGDLVEEFQAGLDADLAADPLLGGHHGDDDAAETTKPAIVARPSLR